uniref:Uncharacterized protein n=1 Tax=viral metagenome TaxID=1070528 RepID=A0A6M3JJQ8_9ZZZZ
MTIEAIRARVEAIKRISDDDEMAHADEDALWKGVLEAIAAGAEDAAALAAEALLTADIPFARWCA